MLVAKYGSVSFPFIGCYSSISICAAACDSDAFVYLHRHICISILTVGAVLALTIIFRVIDVALLNALSVAL